MRHDWLLVASMGLIAIGIAMHDSPWHLMADVGAAIAAACHLVARQSHDRRAAHDDGVVAGFDLGYRAGEADCRGVVVPLHRRSS